MLQQYAFYEVVSYSNYVIVDYRDSTSVTSSANETAADVQQQPDSSVITTISASSFEHSYVSDFYLITYKL